MAENLYLYNKETLLELYAVAYWKVPNAFPKNNTTNVTKSYLIHKINNLSYHLQSKGD